MFKIHRISSALSLIILALGMAAPVRVARAQPVRALDAPALLQFSSAGHVLGFGTQGMYAATGPHALRVDFPGANPVSPEAAAPPTANGQAASLSRVGYPELWQGITLEYFPTHPAGCT